jgi:hypothetical protein
MSELKSREGVNVDNFFFKNYILDEDNNPIEQLDIIKWNCRRGNDKNRVVAKSTIGQVEVSTVFLGIAHGIRNGMPVLFETMIFDEDYDDYQVRYCTWDEALAGHKAAVKLVEEGMK